MDGFLIDTKQTLDAVEYLRQIIAELRGEYDVLNSVSIPPLGSATGDIVARLDPSKAELNDQIASLQTMADALEHIVYMYQSTDEKVAAHATSSTIHENDSSYSSDVVQDEQVVVFTSYQNSPANDNSFVYYYNDRRVFDWTKIKNTLDKPANEITDREYAELAAIYSVMNDYETKLFLKALAEKKELKNVVSNPALGIYHTPESYTVWEYDKTKVGLLMSKLEIIAAEYEESISFVKTASSDELLKYDLGSTLYRNAVETVLDEKYRQTIEQAALLDLCLGLSSSAFSKDVDVAWAGVSAENGELTGESWADGPRIDVYTQGDERKFVFCNTEDYYGQSGVFQHNHLHKNVLTIHTPNISLNDVMVNDMIYTYYSDLYGNTIESSVGIVAEDAISEVLHGFGEKALEESLDGSKLVKAVPVVGSVIDTGIDVYEDYIEKKDRTEEIIRFRNAQNDSIFNKSFRMMGVLITDENSNMMLFKYPTRETKRITDNFNRLAPPEFYEALGTEAPLTVDRLIKEQDNIYGLMENEKYITIWDNIFKP